MIVLWKQAKASTIRSIVKGVGVCGKGVAKQIRMRLRRPQPIEHGTLQTGKTELDGPRSEHRHARLLFQGSRRRMRPGERRRVGAVHQAHAAPRVLFAGRANGSRSPVREGELLLMTAPARLGFVHRQPFVVEKMASQLDLRPGHGVRRRNERLREAVGDIPLELGAILLLRSGRDRGEGDGRQQRATPSDVQHRRSPVLVVS